MIKLLTKMFYPKKIDDPSCNWMVSLERVGDASVYDFNLILEQLLGDKTSYLLELGINPDRTLEIKVTSEKGNFIVHGGTAGPSISVPESVQ